MGSGYRLKIYIYMTGTCPSSRVADLGALKDPHT